MKETKGKELEGKEFCGCIDCLFCIRDGLHTFHCDVDYKNECAANPISDYVTPCGSQY
jgi:hypothetical protein